MNNTKLISILKSFTQVELTKYHHLAMGKYHNRSQRGVVLLEHLLSFAPHFDASDLDKKQVFKAIFPRKKFNPQLLNDDIAHLFSLAKIYLADLESSKKPGESDLLALAQIRKRQLNRVQKAELNKINHKLDKLDFWGEKELDLAYSLAGEQNLFIDQYDVRASGESILQKLNRLDERYLYVKLRDSCELINRGNIFQDTSEFPFLNEIQIYLEKNPKRFGNLPVISLYQKALLTLSFPEVSGHYHQLVKELKLHLHTIPDWEARNLFRYAQNHCIRKINLGEIHYYREIFSLFQIQTKTGILLSDGKINHTTFTNVVTTALRLKEFKWAETFMETYRVHLPSENQKTVYGFNQATYLFENNQMSESIRLLNALEIQDAFYKASARVLLCKAYFIQQEWEALAYLMDTFKRGLTRNKVLSRINRDHYLNFIRHLKKIALLYEKQPVLTVREFNVQKKKIYAFLEKTPLTSNLGWLKNQV